MSLSGINSKHRLWLYQSNITPTTQHHILMVSSINTFSIRNRWGKNEKSLPLLVLIHIVTCQIGCNKLCNWTPQLVTKHFMTLKLCKLLYKALGYFDLACQAYIHNDADMLTLKILANNNLTHIHAVASRYIFQLMYLTVIFHYE